MDNLSLLEPDRFDFWLEYLALQPDLTQWEETFDDARVNWQLALCWRLLREARQRAATSLQKATVWHSEGLLQAQSGDWSRAETCYRAALSSTPADDVERRLLLLGELGMLHRLQGDTQAALEIHQQQLDLAEKHEQLGFQADALDQLGLDCESMGDWVNAQKHLQRALALQQSLGNTEGVAVSQKHLGLVAWRRGKLAEARAYLEQALAAFEWSEQHYDVAQTEGNLGNVCYEQGDLEQAEHHYLRALSIFDELGAVFDKVGLLNNLGGLAFARQDFEKAAQFYQESLASARDLGDRREERNLLINLGILNLRQDRWDEAARFYVMALAIARELDDRRSTRDIRRRQLRLKLLRGLDWLSTKLRRV